MGWGDQSHVPVASTPGKDPVPIVQIAGWAPGPVWTGGKSRPYRDSIPESPALNSVTIPTELPDPHIIVLYYNIILWDHRRICGPSLAETSLCGA